MRRIKQQCGKLLALIHQIVILRYLSKQTKPVFFSVATGFNNASTADVTGDSFYYSLKWVYLLTLLVSQIRVNTPLCNFMSHSFLRYQKGRRERERERSHPELRIGL
jgi:hypothetical protein